MSTAANPYLDVAELGAIFCDEQWPGWHRSEVIDLERFDISDGARCTLGQIGAAIGRSLGCHVDEDGYIGALGVKYVRNGYAVLSHQLEHRWEDDELGFTLGGEPVRSRARGMAYAQLDAAWRVAIRRRRDADAAVAK